MADPAATIVGQGILDGSQVKLPDHGGQWSRVYPRQVLDIQVSGPTADVVQARRAQLIERIDAELAVLQEGVAPSDLITTAVVPAAPSISYMHGSKVRALAMIWVLVGVGVLAAIQILEPRSARQPVVRAPSRRRRTQRQDPGTDAGRQRGRAADVPS